MQSYLFYETYIFFVSSILGNVFLYTSSLRSTLMSAFCNLSFLITIKDHMNAISNAFSINLYELVMIMGVLMATIIL